jgi:hypothetical protein
MRLDLRVLARRRSASVRAAALRLWWKRANPASSGLQRRALEALQARLARPTAVAAVALPGGWQAHARGGWLTLTAPGRRRSGASPAETRSRRPRSAILRAGKPPDSRRASSSPAARLRAADHA